MPAVQLAGYTTGQKIGASLTIIFGALVWKFLASRWVLMVTNKWGAFFIFFLLAIISWLAGFGATSDYVGFFFIGMSAGAVGDDPPQKGLYVPTGVVY